MIKKNFKNQKELYLFYNDYKNKKLDIIYNLNYMLPFIHQNKFANKYFKLKNQNELFFILDVFLKPALQSHFGSPHIIDKQNKYIYFFSYNELTFSTSVPFFFLNSNNIDRDKVIETIYLFEKELLNIVLNYAYNFYENENNEKNDVFFKFQKYIKKTEFFLKKNIEKF